jgi:predicted negative regulator of RcsB-dependent stress response
VTHHPLAIAGVAWWALVGFTVRLDASGLVVGLLPTVAVVANYYFQKRQREQIRQEALKHVAEAQAVATEAKQTADATNHMVNSQKDALEARIAALEAKLRAAHIDTGSEVG